MTLPSGIGISGQWRYFSSVENDTLSNDCNLNAGDDADGDGLCPDDAVSAPAAAQLNSVSFFDLALTARLAERYNFRLGVNNILDREPPITDNGIAGAPFGNGNTYPQVYDSLGRFFFAGVTVDF